MLDEAIDFAEERAPDVPVSGTIRIGHDVSQAILNTAEQHDVDVILMGWRGRSRRRDFALGSNVDQVVTRAPCDVLVERIGEGEGEGDVDSILVPTAGGPHAELAAEIAGAIGRANDAAVEVLYVVSSGADEAERERAEELLSDAVDALDGVESSTRVEEGDVVASIVDASADHDLTVIGATREGLFQQLVLGAIPEAVGRRAEGTVIMAKRAMGIRSRLSRWFRRGGSR